MNRESDRQGKTCHLLLFTPHREDGESWAKTLAKEELEITIVTDLRVAKSYLEKRQYDYLLVGVSSNDCDGMKLLEWANDTIIGIRKCGVLKKSCDELYNRVFRLGADWCFHYESLTVDRMTTVLENLWVTYNATKWQHRKSTGFEQCSKRIRVEYASTKTLLISGPNGAGKSTVARLIHDHSPLRRGPYIVAECAHFTDHHECMSIFRGKAGGIKHPLYRNQQGLLAQANGGTLYIHEVCLLPISVQEVLATVIERGVFMPQTHTKETKFTGRIILSTKMNLSDKVLSGEFSASLYHCICGNVLHVPALAECQDDIIPLAEGFISEQCRQQGIPPPKLTKSAINKLIHHVWPGNVRELFSVISATCNTFTGTTITKEDIYLPEVKINVTPHTRRFNVMRALRHTKGNKAQAAKLLKINRVTLYKWMKLDGIPQDYR